LDFIPHKKINQSKSSFHVIPLCSHNPNSMLVLILYQASCIGCS